MLLIKINRVIGFNKLIIIQITSNCLWLFIICKKFNAQTLLLDYKILRINPKSTISLQHIKLILVLIYSTHYLSIFMYLFRVFVSFIHVVLHFRCLKTWKSLQTKSVYQIISFYECIALHVWCVVILYTLDISHQTHRYSWLFILWKMLPATSLHSNFEQCGSVSLFSQYFLFDLSRCRIYCFLLPSTMIVLLIFF